MSIVYCNNFFIFEVTIRRNNGGLALSNLKIWYILRDEAQAKSHKRPMPGGAFRILDSMLRRGPLVLVFSMVYQSLRLVRTQCPRSFFIPADSRTFKKRKNAIFAG